MRWPVSPCSVGLICGRFSIQSMGGNGENGGAIAKKIILIGCSCKEFSGLRFLCALFAL